MKNIRFYNAPKYTTDSYTEVENNIYRTYTEPIETLDLIGIRDNETVEMLNKLNGWEKGKEWFEEDYYILVHNGIKYYKEIDENAGKTKFYVEKKLEPEVTYVTSLIFEPEPEFGENEPTDKFVSQDPLEDILDEFSCYVSDEYDEENENDANNSYVEFASPDINDIKNLLGIIGKYVYMKEDDEGYAEFIIE